MLSNTLTLGTSDRWNKYYNFR